MVSVTIDECNCQSCRPRHICDQQTPWIFISANVATESNQITLKMPLRRLQKRVADKITESDDLHIETEPSKRRAVASACIPCRKRRSKVSLVNICNSLR
jgi:hypothetical protein